MLSVYRYLARRVLVNMQGEKEFMTTEEAREHLNVSARTLERYARDGLLKKYRRKVGREVFYKRAEVEDLLRIQPVEDVKD